jgi:Flp pilus assembly protein TadB
MRFDYDANQALAERAERAQARAERMQRDAERAEQRRRARGAATRDNRAPQSSAQHARAILGVDFRGGLIMKSTLSFLVFFSFLLLCVFVTGYTQATRSIEQMRGAYCDSPITSNIDRAEIIVISRVCR